jgi:site-specific DNA recombinase
MPNQDLRVAIYARVSGESQAKEDTIASQLEAVERRIADDALECDPELRFLDDGVSGSLLIRPGLERLRDQAAAGAINRLYVLDPDRFSRKYAYQVLLLEELDRCGVEIVFLRNPPGRGPEENLLLQVQGMIAEYERAKIMERCRRGKQHAARRGSVNVLSGAPYGYHYVGKHEGGGEARYQVVAEEARVVRKIFEWVGQERCSIGEVCRRLKGEGIPTRTGKSSWDRSVVWAVLKNPAYRGTAAFGKTGQGEFKPQRLRPQRGRPEHPKRPVSRVDTSAKDQIFIEVPALVDEGHFEAVQAQLEENRQRRRDRPGGGRYLLQGLVVCKRCGYGCYGKPTSRASAKGKVPYAYYRCTGTDAYRFGGQRLCRNKQVRTDVLDAAVWEDVRQLLSEPGRVRAEYERRLQGEKAGPSREVEQINKLISNVKKMICRLIDAYGDGLLVKSEFEPRISAARERLAKLEVECRQRIGAATQEAELRLVIGQLEEFARRVTQGMQGPDWETRREVIRALVKRVEIDDQEVRIVYRVSPSPFEGRPQQGFSQHCWGRGDPALRCAFRGGEPGVLLQETRFQPSPEHLPVHGDVRQEPFVADAIKASFDVPFEDPSWTLPMAQQEMGLSQRIGAATFAPKAIGMAVGVGFRDGIEPEQVECLHGAIGHGGNPEAPQFAVALGDVHPAERLRSVTVPSQGAESGRLGSRCVPEDSVDTGSLRTRIIDHS